MLPPLLLTGWRGCCLLLCSRHVLCGLAACAADACLWAGAGYLAGPHLDPFRGVQEAVG